MLVETKARVGVFAIALGAYLPQFPQLVPEFEGQYADFKKMLPDTVEVIDGGIVTTKEQSMAAGDKFRAADVDLVILQLLTYATSYNMLPAVRDLDVPVVLVNVQKKKAPDYANTDIPTWLGELYACGAVGEMVADLERAGKRHAVITGVVEGGDPVVAAEINDWCKAAQVRRRFRDTNLAQIGRPTISRAVFRRSTMPASREILPPRASSPSWTGNCTPFLSTAAPIIILRRLSRAIIPICAAISRSLSTFSAMSTKAHASTLRSCACCAPATSTSWRKYFTPI